MFLTNGSQCGIMLPTIERIRLLERALDKKGHSSMPSRRETTGNYWNFSPFLGLKGTLYFILHQRIALEKRALFAPKVPINDPFCSPCADADPVSRLPIDGNNLAAQAGSSEESRLTYHGTAAAPTFPAAFGKLAFYVRIKTVQGWRHALRGANGLLAVTNLGRKNTMRFGGRPIAVAVVAAVGLGLGYWVRSVLSPPDSCRSSHFPGSSPKVRIRSILTKPFRGPTDRHCVFFLDDHEDIIREVGREGVPFLARALEDDEPDVRLKATLCLSVLGADAAPAVDALRPLLQSRKDRQAYWTIICLGDIGKASVPAVRDMLSLLRHPRGCPFWQQIGEAVAQISVASEKLPRGMSDLLSDPNPGVRQTAIFALGETGTLAGPLLPGIIASLGDPHLLVRVNVARSLGRLGQRPEVSLPALREALHDPKPSVRCAAAAAIGDFGSRADAAIPELIQLLRHGSSRVRAEAARALGKIGPDAKQAVPGIRRLFADQYPGVRRAALGALARIEGEGEVPVPAHTGALNNEEESIR